MSTVTKLHFRITGEFITEQARTFVLEGEWRRGLKLLVDGVDGCGVDQAVCILTGQLKFVGTDELELVGEDPADVAEYLEQASWQYRGTIRTRQPTGAYVHMEPYAYVNSWGPHDMLECRNRYNMVLKKREGILVNYSPEARSVRYMDDQVWDRAVVVEHSSLGISRSAVVLWKEVQADPPFWVDVPSATSSEDPNWDKAFAAAIEAGKRMEERGHRWLEDREPELAALRKRLYGDKPAAPKPPEPEEPPPPIVPPDPDPTLQYCWGWITPDGRFWGCPYQGHKDLAVRMLWLFQGKEYNTGTADTEAGKLNWLRITEDLDGHIVIYSHGERLVPAQIDTAVRWCEVHSVPRSQFADVLGIANKD